MSDEIREEDPKPSKLRWVVNDVKNDFSKMGRALHISKAENTE